MLQEPSAEDLILGFAQNLRINQIEELYRKIIKKENPMPREAA